MLVPNDKYLVCGSARNCTKRIRRSEREFAADHAHLPTKMLWYKDFKIKLQVMLLRACPSMSCILQSNVGRLSNEPGRQEVLMKTGVEECSHSSCHALALRQSTGTRSQVVQTGVVK